MAGIYAINNIRWDKIPYFGPIFILGYRQIIQISPYTKPITWDQLSQEAPDDYDPYNYLYKYGINNYSRNMLAEYMRENNLAIVPKEYVLDRSSTFEELLEVFEFMPVDMQET